MVWFGLVISVVWGRVWFSFWFGFRGVVLVDFGSATATSEKQTANECSSREAQRAAKAGF